MRRIDTRNGRGSPRRTERRGIARAALAGSGRTRTAPGRGVPGWPVFAARVAAVLLTAVVLLLPLTRASLPATAPVATASRTPIVTATPVPTLPSDATPPPWAHHLMPPVENRIYMAWDLNPITLEKVPPGVNVLAPTWFYVEADEDGEPEVRALNELDEGRRSGWDPVQYVTTAHEGGAQVWATVVLIGNATLVTALVNSPEHVAEFIERCAGWIEQYDLDGISFDFEYMNHSDIDAYTALVGACKQAFGPDIMVSSAVNYILAGDQSNNKWQSYDPAGLAAVCDYVAVMTYSGYQAGRMTPVSGIGWLREEIEEMLLKVPSNQLLMGVPFYGALYQADVVDGDVLEVDPLWAKSDDYRLTVTAATIERALTVGEFKAGGKTYTVDYWVNRGAWEPELGVTTWSFVDTEGMMHTLWCEDENSLYQKGMLATDYHLAGVAVWRLSQGRDAMWEALARGLQAS
ncbi:MAG: hypothetical protein GX549_06905 [Clostridiales bacterium]|nr:hypothetical protein [Clostridiales bacterium]